MGQTIIQGRVLVGGQAVGPLLYSQVPLSFWGGVDAATGRVIDRLHPLHGEQITGKILAIPSGRGSCTGSAVLLELIANGAGPAGLLLASADEVLTLGALIGEVTFGGGIPVVCIAPQDFERLERATHVELGEAGRVAVSGPLSERRSADAVAPAVVANAALHLTAQDAAMLAGDAGEAAAAAMRIVCRMAEIAGAVRLIDVTRVHVDGCIYTGPASLAFARRLVALGGRVRVPTTLNAISVDRLRWREQGIDPAFGLAADALAQAYVDMGAASTFTCAPYLLDDRPGFGEQIGWAESNAVVYANSVLGARTMKYPDFLDICIGLTGRAPEAGCHLTENRFATLEIAIASDAVCPAALADAYWPLLGHIAGTLAGRDIPVLTGLAAAAPGGDDLKSFGAAFATTSAAPMFHIVGVTPEAPDLAAALGGATPRHRFALTLKDLAKELAALNAEAPTAIDLVALGNPHLSLSELQALAALCSGRRRNPKVQVIATCGRHILMQAEQTGLISVLEGFGVRLVTDTCWCMITRPLVPLACRGILTNSAKYAHYGPGLTNCAVGFAPLSTCIDAAVSGTFDPAGLRL